MKTFLDYGIYINQSQGGEQKTKCPQCTPNRKKQHLKDLAVNISKGVWKCHHCGWSGSLPKISPDHLKQYQAATQKVYSTPAPIENYEIPAIMVDYFKQRGISQVILEMCGVTYEQEFMSQTGKKENCIVFNYFINGKLINKKFRAKNKRMRMVKNARLVMYSPLAKDKNHKYEGDLYITEGEPDCLTLIEAGIKNAMSIPNGAPPLNTNLNKYDFSYLESLQEIMPDYEKVFLVMDNDEPGERLRDELARRLGIEICHKAVYPEDCKDINEVLQKYGKETVVRIIENCEAYPIKGKYNVKQLWKQVINLYENGYDSGLSIGWRNVEKLYNIKRQQITVITGIPSAGKSAFMDNIIINLAKQHEFKSAIFSPENYPFERHIASLSEIYIGKSFDKNNENCVEYDDIFPALEWLHSHFCFLMPEDDDNCTIDDILRLARAAVFRDGIDGLLIDPWNEIEHNRGFLSETEYVSKMLTKVRKFSRLNNIHIWIVAHPTKLPKNKDGDYPIPTPYDISGSANWRNKADNCLCVHRDDQNRVTKLLIQKIRFKEVGQLGVAEFVYDMNNGRFNPLDIFHKI